MRQSKTIDKPHEAPSPDSAQEELDWCDGLTILDNDGELECVEAVECCSPHWRRGGGSDGFIQKIPSKLVVEPGSTIG